MEEGDYSKPKVAKSRSEGDAINGIRWKRGSISALLRSWLSTASSSSSSGVSSMNPTSSVESESDDNLRRKGDILLKRLGKQEKSQQKEADDTEDNSLSSSDSMRLICSPGDVKCIQENWRRKCVRSLRTGIQVALAGQVKGVGVQVFVQVFGGKELLEKLFNLFDQKKEGELNQDEWIEFLKSRLDNREERQVDFVEVLESVAYAVCGEDPIRFDDFCVIFRTKNVLNKFFRVIDRDLDGVVTEKQIMDFISALSTARTNNRLTKESIKWLEHLFKQYVGPPPGNEITKEDFKKIIQTKNQFFTDRVFDIFDNDASGAISLQEFINAMHQFAGQEPDDKLLFLFKIYDVDGDGLIQCEELEEVMRACMEENGMKFSENQISELTMALFEDADVEKRGALTFEALKAQLMKHEGLLENLSISIERWLVPPEPKDAPSSSFSTPLQTYSISSFLRKLRPHQLSIRYLKNNYVYLGWIFIFLLTNVALFVSKCVVFHRHNSEMLPTPWFLMLARGAGQCLNFNCTMIVVWMLRQCLTFLRARGASHCFPIDQHIYFHKLTGFFIFGFALFHTIMHLINLPLVIVPNPVYNPGGNWTYLDFLFFPKPTSESPLKLGLIPGYAYNSGVILTLILTVMVVCSLPFVRRGGCFEVFYWTHLLYSVFWVLLIIHAPNFWKWFCIPGLIFLIEKILRYYNSRMGRGRTCVTSGILLPSKVTHLVIRRPPNFEFHPGDYVFVRIPTIAKYEWHPFTISSAPEQEDAIWLHIRAVGEWTTRLYDYFDGEQQIMDAFDECKGLSFRKRCDTLISDGTWRSRSQRNLEEPTNKDDPKNMRMRLPTVGTRDSQETVHPVSSVSSFSMLDPEKDVIDLSSSNSMEMGPSSKKQETGNDNSEMPKKVALSWTISLPNVGNRDGMVQHENDEMNAAESSLFSRSFSVAGVLDQDDTVFWGPGTGTNRVPRSLRYMRNKPRIISLKTPSYENNKAGGGGDNPPNSSGLTGGDQKRRNSKITKGIMRASKPDVEGLAEEGRLGPSETQPSKSNNKDMEEYFNSELHPIMGTTRGDGACVGRPLEIYIDGPYGAPSSHIFRAEHAVLIATGIGVTPFASILQSIMHRYWTSRVSCPNCRFTWCAELPQSVLNLRKVDFFWINRDQRSFEWFVHLLSQLEIEQAELGGAMERFLDMHMYITSALQKTDMKAVGLQLALDLLHEREKRDLITGLKTKTHAGRPNWSKVFKQLADQGKGKVTVYYCGPPALGKTLKVKCHEFGFSFRKEIF